MVVDPGDDTIRRRLSRTLILDTAAEMLASGQVSVFSMRKLAERLDVTPMAVYRWFANKAELLEALTERLEPMAPVESSPDAPWVDRGLAYAVAIRTNLVQHLPLLQIDGASRRLTTNVVRSADPGLRLMVELGYRDAAAVDAYRVLFWSVLDFCLVIDATDALPTTAGSHEVIERVVELEGDDLAERLPTLAALLPHFRDVDRNAFFELSIRTVLAGLQANAPAT